MRTQGLSVLAVRLAALAICGGALGFALIAVAALCGRFDARLDVLAHFTPFYLVGACACLITSAPLPRTPRRIGLTTAAVAIVACGALMAPEYLANRGPTPPPGDGAHDLKVIEFNVWGGNRKAQPALAWLLKENADIIVLEEGGPVSDLVKLGKYHLSCGNCTGTILTKAAPTWANTPANWRIKPESVSAVVLGDPRGQITILAVHRSWGIHPHIYEPEMADLARAVEKFPQRYMIVAGDFNSTPWSAARRREDRSLGLIRRTRALFTWPADPVSHDKFPTPFPVLPIDHVYAGPGWATVRVERGPKLGSDHYPVVVTLRRINGRKAAAAPSAFKLAAR